MKRQTSNPIMKQRGFTIIEVALVLAIAGLIFLVVFLALSALQNSQKDTARKQDVGRVVSVLESYMADHNGDLSIWVPQVVRTAYGMGSLIAPPVYMVTPSDN